MLLANTLKLLGLLSLATLSLASSSHTLTTRTQHGTPAGDKRATVCNGHAELCDRSFGNVTFIGAHNSYAIGATNIAANQDQNIETQLNNGIRMLQVQAHNSTTGIRLCHSSCLLYDGGLFSTFLTTVQTWAVANPTEVLSILIVNINNLPVSSFASVYQSTGVASISYAPSRATTALANWPTLGSMIDSGLRIVTFMDNKADFTTAPYILDEFSQVVEDAFGALSNAFPCTANRTTGTPSNQLVLTNHFTNAGTGSSAITVPDKTRIVQTNSQSGTGSVGQGAANCAAVYSRAPNFMLLDFYNSAGLAPFLVAASLNGVAAPTNDVAAYTGGTSSSAVTSSPVSGSKPSTSVTSLSGAQSRLASAGAAQGVLLAAAGLSLGVFAVL